MIELRAEIKGYEETGILSEGKGPKFIIYTHYSVISSL